MEVASRIENWRGLVQAEGYEVDSDVPGEEVRSWNSISHNLVES